MLRNTSAVGRTRFGRSGNDPQSAIAHLIRARYDRQAGWGARPDDSDMVLAKTDIQAAIKLGSASVLARTAIGPRLDH